MNAITTILEPGRESEAIRVLGNSLYPGAKPESIALVLSYCRMNGLDPMLKPVHIVPTSVKLPNGRYETRDVLMPGIADYRIKAARSGEYGGKSEPEFGPDVTRTFDKVSVTYPQWCRVTISRIVQGQPRAFTAVERWTENYATAARDTEAPNRMWLKRAYGQLAKCAESQALRMAFPEFSSGYTAEEMEGKTGDFDGTTIQAEPATNGAALGDEIPGRVMDAPAKKRTVRDLVRDKLHVAATAEDVEAVAELPAVKRALAEAPEAVRDEIGAMLSEALARVHGAEDAAEGALDAEAPSNEEASPGDRP